VSPGTSALEVLITLVGFTVLYGGLAIVEVGLLVRRIRAGLPAVEVPDGPGGGGDADRPVAFAY
jgi:cytochrome d ubiquinol oxidase subunit I